MPSRGTRPLHPGEVLREEFLQPLGISVNALSRALYVTPSRLNDVVLERRGISADTALRLARCFGTTARFWLTLQLEYELRRAEIGSLKRIEREVKPCVARPEAI